MKPQADPTWFSAVYICCLGILLYAGVLHYPFHFDDQGFILHNPDIRDIRDLPGIWASYPSRFMVFLSLVPEAGAFMLEDVIFEHRLYLPMAGFSMFLAGGLFYLRLKKSAAAATAVLTLVVVVNSWLTLERNRLWRDELTLWTDAVNKYRARTFKGLSETGGRKNIVGPCLNFALPTKCSLL
jgi:hypothetical protein